MSSAPGVRAVALEAIRRVVDDEGYSTLVIPSALDRSGLRGRDRAFAADLAYGTLRHLRTVDWVIERCSDRPIDRMSPGTGQILRLGAYQLMFGGVAAHAAVSETVELAGPREKGFVNAILRRIANDPPQLPTGTEDADVALRTGVAPWMIAELRKLVGSSAEDAAAAFAKRASLSLRANTCRAGAAELQIALLDAGFVSTPSTIDPDCLLLEKGDPAKLPGFAEGWFAVQDEASVAVVRALDPRPGELIFDACAAPGGKASMISCLVGDDGRVVASDVRPRRVELILKGARRLGGEVKVLVQDSARPALRPRFDGVLVDAPCSGIGASRRRPELLWRPKAADLSGLAKLQVGITVGAADLLRPGGKLIYSVCTFPRVETDAVADAILRHRRDLEPATVQGPDGPAERFRLWPHIHGCDGMFVAGFTRSG